VHLPILPCLCSNRNALEQGLACKCLDALHEGLGRLQLLNLQKAMEVFRP